MQKQAAKVENRTLEDPAIRAIEIEFTFTFTQKLTAQKVYAFSEYFIEQAEKHHLRVAGKYNARSISGCMDLSESNLTAQQGIALLESIAKVQQAVIQSSIIGSSPD